jgi:hypothetical protein
MIAKIVGYKKLDFLDSQNKPIVGTQIFSTFSDDPDVIGHSADKFFIRPEFPLPANLAPGIDLDIEFNRKGKIIAIRSVEPSQGQVKLNLKSS